ncbi:MAG: GPW/gp25 family protein [Cyanobacteria bacterium J06632_22]
MVSPSNVSDDNAIAGQAEDSPQALLGQGWGFPLRLTVQGGLQFSQTFRNLEESIIIILGTRLGERLYRPDFGSRLHELVFAPLNEDTLLLAQIYAREAIKKWEPRVSVDTVTATAMPDNASLNIYVSYRIKATRQRRNLIYPFYLTPADE